MKILLVTEKCSQNENERDGGARLVETIQKALGGSLSIMQFGPTADPSATWHFDYPSNIANRFERRLMNASFIAEQVKCVEKSFTHVIFIHVSMQFGFIDIPLHEDIDIWTFPMFLTPSYRASGETVPEKYFEMERRILSTSKNILTPSHLEKRQLIGYYSVPEERIFVVPRGIQTHLLKPKIRYLKGAPIFCSVGSIKPQKDILGLIRMFAKAQERFPGAKLRIIGPVQNSEYFIDVCRDIENLRLTQNVEFTGYVPPNLLPLAIQDAHLHLSASKCETFGRSIFETLASGLPNIARKTGNASAEFLEHVPYARFVDDEHETLNAIDEMLKNLSKLSSMALEIGNLYDDEMLSRLLIAKICSNDLIIAISDFDGTLYHKDDYEKTLRSFEAFRKFPLKVICSARPIHDLLDQLRHYNLEVDWIVASSGSIVTNGNGKLLYSSPLELNDVSYLEELIPETKRIEIENEVLQIAVPAHLLPNIIGFRIEIYQSTAFIALWHASKLRAVHRLLNSINWAGQVLAFGDGAYDTELLTYFDGTWITPSPKNKFQKKEIGYV